MKSLFHFVRICATVPNYTQPRFRQAVPSSETLRLLCDCRSLPRRDQWEDFHSAYREWVHRTVSRARCGALGEVAGPVPIRKHIKHRNELNRGTSQFKSHAATAYCMFATDTQSLGVLCDIMPETVSIEEILKHSSKDDCWIVVDDVVWDITNFAPSHPGGQDSKSLHPTQIPI